MAPCTPPLKRGLRSWLLAHTLRYRRMLVTLSWISEPFVGGVVREGHVVRGVGAPFGDVLALEARPGRGHVLVDRPAEAAVVDDHAGGGNGAERVRIPAAAFGLPVGAGAHADVAD